MADSGIDRTPPQNIEAEQSVLGAMLIDPNEAGHIAVRELQPGDFYRAIHATIFDVTAGMIQRDEPVDLTTLTHELKTNGQLDNVGGAEYLVALTGKIPATANMSRYCSIVKDASLSRKILQACSRTQEVAHDHASSGEDALLYMIDQVEALSTGSNLSGMVHGREVVRELHDDIERAMSGDMPAVAKTGFPTIDKYTGGLRRGEMTVLGGYPGMGKSSIALGMVGQFDPELKVAISSFDMRMTDCVAIIAAQRCRLPVSRLRGTTGEAPEFTDDEWSRFTTACDELSNGIEWWLGGDDQTEIDKVIADAKRIKSQSGLDVWIIDHSLQLTSDTRKGSRMDEIEHCVRKLARFAKACDVQVVLLSQLRKPEQGRVSIPTENDLYGSSALIQEPSVILMVHRALPESGGIQEVTHLHMRKARYGPKCAIELVFDPAFQEFREA